MIKELLYELGFVGQFLVSLLLGLLIGLERELHDKPAGMRTYSLIAAASTALVLLGFEIVEVFSGHFDDQLIRADPVRVIQAIIVGISFVGAGSILKDPETNAIQNLTTAASILAVAAMGIAVALSKYYFAVSITIIILIINWILMFPEKWIRNKAGIKRKRKK